MATPDYQCKNVFTMGQAISSCFSNYAKFTGRACRAEYWYFTLFNFIVSFALSLIFSALSLSSGNASLTFIPYLWTLAIFLPSLSVSFRRLHDTGRSGWNILLALIPLVGAIILIVFVCQDSQPGENRYGNNPKESTNC